MAKCRLENYATSCANACLGTSCTFGGAVTGCINTISNIAVIANSTCVSGVTAFGTSGSSYYCAIFMSVCRYFVSNVRIVTNSTCVSGVTAFGASRSGYY